MTTESLEAETDLTRTVAQLLRRVDVLESEQAVRNLHHIYGYYLDKCLYEEVVDLFSETGEVIFANGIYKGRAGLRRLYIDRFQQRFTKGYNGPQPGFLLDHPMLQDVITIDESGDTAHARFRCLMQAGVHDSVKDTFVGQASFDQWWEGGLYENTYVRENGVWKINRLGYRSIWHGPFDIGWAHSEPLKGVFATKTFPEDPKGPDELIEGAELFPNTDVLPFHYAHPVTGEAWQPAAQS